MQIQHFVITELTKIDIEPINQKRLECDER